MKHIETSAKVITNIIVTFIQSSIAFWLASGMQTDKVAIAGAIGAGLSVLWNTVIKPLLVADGWIKG